MNKNQVNDTAIYETVKLVLFEAREKAYSAVNLAMVEAYWNIGRIVCEAQGAHERAEYGEYLIRNLSKS
jgi:hypothetical protein